MGSTDMTILDRIVQAMKSHAISIYSDRSGTIWRVCVARTFCVVSSHITASSANTERDRLNALTVLDCLRDPTEEMKHSTWLESDEAESIWQAMIDAGKGEV